MENSQIIFQCFRDHTAIENLRKLLLFGSMSAPGENIYQCVVVVVGVAILFSVLVKKKTLYF